MKDSSVELEINWEVEMRQVAGFVKTLLQQPLMV